MEWKNCKFLRLSALIPGRLCCGIHPWNGLTIIQVNWLVKHDVIYLLALSSFSKLARSEGRKVRLRPSRLHSPSSNRITFQFQFHSGQFRFFFLLFKRRPIKSATGSQKFAQRPIDGATRHASEMLTSDLTFLLLNRYWLSIFPDDVIWTLLKNAFQTIWLFFYRDCEVELRWIELKRLPLITHAVGDKLAAIQPISR